MAFLPAIGMAVSVAGAISQASAQADAARSSGEAQKQAEEYNAAVYGQQAELIQRQADLSIYQQSQAAKRLRAQQAVGYAKAGVLLEGSPTAVMIDSAANAEMDMMITKYNADLEKRRALSEGTYHTFLGNQYEAAGVNNANAAWATAAGNIGSTLLTSASNFASRKIPTYSKGEK